MRGVSISTTAAVIMAALAALGSSPAAAAFFNSLDLLDTWVEDNKVIARYERSRDMSLTTQFRMFEVDCTGGGDKCKCDLDKGEVDGTVLWSNGILDEDEGTFRTFNQYIEFNKTKIYSSTIWSGSSKSNGTLAFCARADLLSNFTNPSTGDYLSVSFREHVIRLNVNLLDNVFALNGGDGVSIELDDVETSDQNFTNVYEVEAYQCRDGYSKTTGAVNQNDPLKMCLRPNSTDVRIASFDITSVKHGSNDTEYESILGVTDGEEKTIFVTILDDGDDAGIATKKLEMLIPADMYEEPDYPVKIQGTAELEFVGDDPEVSEAPSLMPSITPVPGPPSSSPVIAPTARRRIQVRMGGESSSFDAAAEDLEEQQNHQEEGQRLLQAGGESAGTAPMNLEVALAPAADDGAMHDLDKEHVKNSGDEHQGRKNPPEDSSAATALATASLKVTALVVAVSMALV